MWQDLAIIPLSRSLTIVMKGGGRERKHFEIRNRGERQEFILTQGAEINIAIFAGLDGYLPKVLHYKEIVAIFCNHLDSLDLTEYNVLRQSPTELIFSSS